MSVKKSWDVERKRVSRTSAPAPVSSTRGRSVEMVRTRTRSVEAVRQDSEKERRVRAKRPVGKKTPLKTRRKEARTVALIVWIIFIFLAVGALLYTVWMPSFRATTVVALGPDTEGITRVTKDALAGTHFLVIPRNSIFFIPENDIRTRVLDAYPQVQAVSISASGLSSLKITALVRASSFTWCGESVIMPADTCYEADAEGLVFAPTTEKIEAVMSTTTPETATTSLPQKKAEPSKESALLVYGPLEGAENGPVRAHVTYASALPGALKFVKAMRSLGAEIHSVTLRGDEIDLHTKVGTRITYVIGNEGQAAILASTSFPTLNLNDGSLEYVDLRFENKVYLKRKGEVVEPE